jgi:hypothetical protein
MEKKEVKVDIQLLQELINYLQQKPYHEVYQLIGKIIEVSNKE